MILHGVRVSLKLLHQMKMWSKVVDQPVQKLEVTSKNTTWILSVPWMANIDRYPITADSKYHDWKMRWKKSFVHQSVIFEFVTICVLLLVLGDSTVKSFICDAACRTTVMQDKLQTSNFWQWNIVMSHQTFWVGWAIFLLVMSQVLGSITLIWRP